MKPKKCKICKDKFEPTRPLQMVCGYVCASIYAKEQKKKAWKKRKKVLKEKLKTRTEYLKDAQKEFNRYIRLRDKDNGCISCGKPLIHGNIDASHFYSVGAYPRLRFNEDNVHASCVYCNRYMHGNIAEYTIRLPKKIGIKRFEKLCNERNLEPLSLTIDEIKEIREKYRLKANEFKQIIQCSTPN